LRQREGFAKVGPMRRNRERSAEPGARSYSGAPRFVAGAAIVALFALIGCGHPATREDCEEIFTRSAEIELRAQNISDAKTIAERTAAVKAARGEDLIRQCVGKRITTRAMDCVRRANSAVEVDRCLE
jgi:hypothetical protein